MHSIPFYKPSIGEPEINEVVDCLRTGWLTTGPKAKQLETEFARYTQHTHAVAVNSCTAALHLALEAVGLKAGQTVVVPTMTFAATADRKSTRLNSSHLVISYAVFCLKKKKTQIHYVH